MNMLLGGYQSHDINIVELKESVNIAMHWCEINLYYLASSAVYQLYSSLFHHKLIISYSVNYHFIISSSIYQLISSSVHQFTSLPVHQITISSSVYHQLISLSVYQFISSSSDQQFISL